MLHIFLAMKDAAEDGAKGKGAIGVAGVIVGVVLSFLILGPLVIPTYPAAHLMTQDEQFASALAFGFCFVVGAVCGGFGADLVLAGLNESNDH